MGDTTTSVANAHFMGALLSIMIDAYSIDYLGNLACQKSKKNSSLQSAR